MRTRRLDANAHKARFALLPTVDHVRAGDTEAAFRICAWRTNDAKGDLSPDDFIKLCIRVLEDSGHSVTKRRPTRTYAANTIRSSFAALWNVFLPTICGAAAGAYLAFYLERRRRGEERIAQELSQCHVLHFMLMHMLETLENFQAQLFTDFETEHGRARQWHERRHEARTDQSVCQQVGNPGRIVHVGLAARHVLDVRRIGEHQLKVFFQNVPNRLPINARRFHGDVRAAHRVKPLAQLQ